MTNPGWAYNDKTATRINRFRDKGATFTWSDVTYNPKAKTKAYAPTRPEPVLTAAQAAWVVDAPRLIKKRK